MRGSRYAPEFREPLIDKEYYRKPVAELTEEEKYDQELKKTQFIKAAAATETSSVFADPVIRFGANAPLLWAETHLGQFSAEGSGVQPGKANHVFLLEANSPT